MTTATLDSQYLYWIDAQNQTHKEDCDDVDFQMLSWTAMKYKLDSIWITPGSRLSERMFDMPQLYILNTHDLPPELQVTQVDHQRTSTREYGGKKYPVSFSATRTIGEKKTVRVFVPQLDDRWAEDKIPGWSLAECENPRTLLTALLYLERAFGIPLGGPGYTGIELMRKTTENHPHYWRTGAADVIPAHIETDLVWHRPLTPVEQLSKYLHLYDGNGKYLAACTGAKLGVGVPEHLHINIWPDDALTQAMLKGAPGVWRFKPDRGAPSYVFKDAQIGADGTLWAYTPVVAELMREKYAIYILEGYLWEEWHETLRTWAEKLWKVRQDLKTNESRYPNREAALIAQKMSKIIAVHGVGWLDLASERAKPKGEHGTMHHPDKRNTIIALVKARMMRTIAQFQEKGYQPCLIQVDELGYISDDPNPDTAIPGLMARKEQLGGFKHAHTFELTPDIIKLFGKKNVLLKRELNAIARRGKEAPDGAHALAER
jgi:hypothetical protein